MRYEKSISSLIENTYLLFFYLKSDSKYTFCLFFSKINRILFSKDTTKFFISSFDLIKVEFFKTQCADKSKIKSFEHFETAKFNDLPGV